MMSKVLSREVFPSGASLRGLTLEGRRRTAIGSLNNVVHDCFRHVRQGLSSGFGAVHLKHVCRNVHDGVVIHIFKLEERVARCILKPGNESGRGSLSPAA